MPNYQTERKRTLSGWVIIEDASTGVFTMEMIKERECVTPEEFFWLYYDHLTIQKASFLTNIKNAAHQIHQWLLVHLFPTDDSDESAN